MNHSKHWPKMAFFAVILVSLILALPVSTGIAGTAQQTIPTARPNVPATAVPTVAITPLNPTAVGATAVFTPTATATATATAVATSTATAEAATTEEAASVTVPAATATSILPAVVEETPATATATAVPGLFQRVSSPIVIWGIGIIIVLIFGVSIWMIVRAAAGSK